MTFLKQMKHFQLSGDAIIPGMMRKNVLMML